VHGSIDRGNKSRGDMPSYMIVGRRRWGWAGCRRAHGAGQYDTGVCPSATGVCVKGY
jgi:hypothetical protein